MSFTTTFEGLDEVITRMKRRIDVLIDLQPSLLVAGEEFAHIEEGHFDSEGNGKWAPLAPLVPAFKAQQGHSGGTMVRTGALKAELTSGKPLSISATEITLGTTKLYAKFHQKGFKQVWALGRGGGGNIYLHRRRVDGYTPARKPIDLTPENKRMISFRAAIDLRRRLREV